jgi:hypothetical protein
MNEYTNFLFFLSMLITLLGNGQFTFFLFETFSKLFLCTAVRQALTWLLAEALEAVKFEIDV